MTGYGKGIAVIEERRLTIEMRSVNHRFLDLSIRLPRALQFAEDNIRKIISQKISRGHIDVYVTYEDKRSLKSHLIIDEELSLRYILEAKKLEKLGSKNNFGTAEILFNKDIVSVEYLEDDESVLMNLVVEATEAALLKIMEMKITEGTKLSEDLSLKVEEMEKTLKTIKGRAPTVIEEYREKLLSRIKDIMDCFEVDQNRLIQEVAVYTDRSNIDEEIIRLQAHIDHYRKILKEGGSVGKPLDFLTQEANREANTIGSKSNDSNITENTLILKSIIEMMREQIQNLE